MNLFFKAIGILLFIIMMAYGAFTQKQYSWLFSLLLIAVVILTIYNDMVENVRAVFWGCAFFLGMLWSGKEMILSIDFDKPFLISFYWSTLGYLTLTALLMALTILAFIQASKDYSFDKN
jgi:hypothetical protein